MKNWVKDLFTKNFYFYFFKFFQPFVSHIVVISLHFIILKIYLLSFIINNIRRCNETKCYFVFLYKLHSFDDDFNNISLKS